MRNKPPLRPATLRLWCTGMLALLALGCLWGVVDSRRPVPEPLLQASGSVESLRITQRRGRDDQVYFRLSGHTREFNFTQGVPGVDEVMERLRVGSQVELQLGPRGNFDIWAFRLNGRDLLRPDERQRSLRRGGYVAAVLAACCVLLGRWLWRALAPGKQRR